MLGDNSYNNYEMLKHKVQMSEFPSTKQAY